MKYTCLHAQQFVTKDGYSLIPLRKQDIQLIREWRNAQIDILRQQQPITEEDQENYYADIVTALFSQKMPPQILFSFLKAGKCIGYGGIVHIDWIARRGEVSFLINPDLMSDYVTVFNRFYSLIQHVAFHDLKFHRLFTETFAFRTDHMALIEKIGFKREGHLRDHTFKRGRWYDSIIHGILAGESTYEL